MRYTVTVQIIDVIGELWMGGKAVLQKELSAYDMENIGDPTKRDDVELWLLRNSGDFQRVIDFRADFTIGNENIIHDFAKETSEELYNDCMFPNYNEED